MVQNHDMKTWVKKTFASTATATNSTNIGSGIIPTGMKRFITYIRANRVLASGIAVTTACHIQIAEVSTSKPTLASAVAATNMKYVVGFPSKTVGSNVTPSILEIGQPGSVNPVLSISGGTFAGIVASGATTDMVVQYYDE